MLHPFNQQAKIGITKVSNTSLLACPIYADVSLREHTRNLKNSSLLMVLYIYNCGTVLKLNITVGNWEADAVILRCTRFGLYVNSGIHEWLKCILVK